MMYAASTHIMSLCAIALSFHCADPTAPQPPSEIAKRAFRSTVLLLMEDSNGQPLSLGSGFFLRDGQIATNLHVIERATRGYAKLVGHEARYEIKGVALLDRERDLAILYVNATGIHPLAIGNSDTVQVGDPVYAVGNPEGLEGTFSQGIVSSIRQVSDNQLLQITAPISPGSSGGPVLNASGEVIGVSVATFRAGQNLNFAIPSRYLTALSKSTATTQPLALAAPTTTGPTTWGEVLTSDSQSVVGTHFSWDTVSAGGYSLSLRNFTSNNIGCVRVLVIFYDKNNEPVHVDTLLCTGILLPGLARRVTGHAHDSVQRIAKKASRIGIFDEPNVEIRILDFRILKNDIDR